jgi:RNA polymerase sigma factor (sigma-70 family)
VAQDDSPVPLEALARDLIRRKTRRLIKRHGLNEHDAEDLEQELLLRLPPILKRCDPARGDPRAFLGAAIHKHLANLLRNRQARRRDYRRTSALDVRPDSQAEGTRADALADTAHDARLGRHGRSAEEQARLRQDVADVVARLPDDLRVLAELLQTRTLAEAARELGVSRSTLVGQRERLRQWFERAGLDDNL